MISPDGYGLTNFHVIASVLKTRKAFGGLSDGKRYPLEVLGIDPTGDLAMFRMTGKDAFDCAELGDSDAVQVGDNVFAAGNPFMLAEDNTPTITAGIVSGVHRYQYGQDARSLVYTDCIQIDASINPGNSGGPLFDAAGRLIGINGRASFERRGRVNVGLAYAISVNQIKRFIPGLKAGLLVEHGSLGATAVDAGFRQVIFDKVAERATAATAGIKPGDRLAAFAGSEIQDANHFTNLLGSYPAGWPVQVTWEREGRSMSKTIELDPLTVKFPDELKRLYQIDLSVTRKAAESPATAPSSASEPAANELAPAIEPAVRSTVKLYGGRLGTAVGYGTGVIVTPQGDVVTTLSVLVEGSDLRAVTHDGHAYPCTVTYRDPYRQLALLQMARKSENADTAAPLREQMTPPTWEPLKPADSVAMQPGDWILAVGNPCKVADGPEAVSVTRGILAGRTRLDAVQGSDAFPYRGDVLLLDAMTSNPGSPGSAVVDLDGRWIGLVGEVVTSRLTNTELNYAYSGEDIKGFLRDAAAAGNAGSQPQAVASHPAAGADKPGYHGIRLSTIAYHRQLPFVKSVADGSPAKAAGVRADDLIISANRVAVPQGRVFLELCERLHPGDELALIVKRGEELIPVHFVLTEAPK